jgi:hypothetical protein
LVKSPLCLSACPGHLVSFWIYYPTIHLPPPPTFLVSPFTLLWVDAQFHRTKVSVFFGIVPPLKNTSF